MSNSLFQGRESQLREEYLNGSPFSHLVLDNFISEEFLQKLLVQFPSFNSQFSLSENGAPEGKAVRSEFRSLGSAYRELDTVFRSESFLTSLELIVGIPHLVFDPTYYGGGTHESLRLQSLDPHIDFNLHPLKENLFRRVNLLLYLNPDWKPTDGGNLELYRDPYGDEIPKLICPLANRCVIFETNEKSWHGHDKILNPDHSRKSIAVYFYTKASTNSQLPHRNAIYVDRKPPPKPSREELGKQVEIRKKHLSRLLLEEEKRIQNFLKLNSLNREILEKMRKAETHEDFFTQIRNLENRIKKKYELTSDLEDFLLKRSEEVFILDFYT